MNTKLKTKYTDTYKEQCSFPSNREMREFFPKELKNIWPGA